MADKEQFPKVGEMVTIPDRAPGDGGLIVHEGIVSRVTFPHDKPSRPYLLAVEVVDTSPGPPVEGELELQLQVKDLLDVYWTAGEWYARGGLIVGRSGKA